MKNPNDLFQLIKSMTKSEKRYFKLQASKHRSAEKNNSIRLFDAIDEQQKYNEDAIRTKFQRERFIRQLAVQKNYLYDLILRILRTYHEGKSAESEVTELLQSVEVLNQRCLYNQCEDLLAKANQIAHLNELFTLLLRIESMAAEIAYKTDNRKWCAQLMERRHETIDKLANLTEYNAMLNEMVDVAVRHGFSRHPDAISAARRVMCHPLLADEGRALSFKAKIVFHDVRYYCAIYLDGPAICYEYAKKRIALLESNPGFVNDYIDRYTFALGTLIDNCLLLRKFDEMEIYLQRLAAVDFESEDARTRALCCIDMCRAEIYIAKGEFSEGLDYLRPVIESLGENGPSTRMGNINICYIAAVLYFAHGDQVSALRHINAFINKSEKEVREDFRRSARHLLLIIHYELGNFDYLEYAIKSAQRFLRKNNLTDPFDEFMFRLFRRLLRTAAPADRAREFARAAVEAAGHFPCDISGCILLFDTVGWLQSMASGQGYGEVVHAARHNSANVYAPAA